MGNCKGKGFDPFNKQNDSAFDRVTSRTSTDDDCLIYQLADYQKGGDLVKFFTKEGPRATEDLLREQIPLLLYQKGEGQVVTRADYLRWKYRKKKQVAIPINEDVPGWQDHKACWSFDYRGALGESLLHVLIVCNTSIHCKLAKMLIMAFRNLALDFVEGPEFRGASALHLAIAYNNMELIKLLVESGAGVEQRAVGTFFLPRDQQRARPAWKTDYEGLAYFGEYPLAWAACCNNESAYNLLIDRGADPNSQDSFGNMVLHMVVVCDKLEMYGYALRHPRIQAKMGVVNKAGLTPLTLSCHLGRATIFREMLELTAKEFWRYSNITCSAYPLNALDTILPDGRCNMTSALMIILNGTKEEHLDMLDGGIIQRLLEEKWKTFARMQFLKRLIILFLHLLSLSVAVYTRPNQDRPLMTDVDHLEPIDYVRFTFEILTCLSCVGYVVIAQSSEIRNLGIKGYLSQLSHNPAKTIFLASNFLTLACIPCRLTGNREAEEVILIFSVPSAWFFLMFFAGAIRLTGPFVTMIYSMITGDMLTFAIIYSIMLLAFSQAFFFLHRGHPDKPALFGNWFSTWMGLFQWTLGDYNYPSLGETIYPALTKIVFVIFMIMVPILLLNMLIAMMGNTYALVIQQSEKEWVKQWAKIVIALERAVSQMHAKEYLVTYSIKVSGGSDGSDGAPPQEEVRGVMVIKSKNKTRARQRKGALNNWKRVGRVTINELKRRGIKGEHLRRQIWDPRTPSTTSINASPCVTPLPYAPSAAMLLMDMNGTGLPDMGIADHNNFTGNSPLIENAFCFGAAFNEMSGFTNTNNKPGHPVHHADALNPDVFNEELLSKLSINSCFIEDAIEPRYTAPVASSPYPSSTLPNSQSPIAPVVPVVPVTPIVPIAPIVPTTITPAPAAGSNIATVMPMTPSAPNPTPILNPLVSTTQTILPNQVISPTSPMATAHPVVSHTGQVLHTGQPIHAGQMMRTEQTLPQSAPMAHVGPMGYPSSISPAGYVGHQTGQVSAGVSPAVPMTPMSVSIVPSGQTNPSTAAVMMTPADYINSGQMIYGTQINSTGSMFQVDSSMFTFNQLNTGAPTVPGMMVNPVTPGISPYPTNSTYSMSSPSPLNLSTPVSSPIPTSPLLPMHSAVPESYPSHMPPTQMNPIPSVNQATASVALVNPTIPATIPTIPTAATAIPCYAASPHTLLFMDATFPDYPNAHHEVNVAATTPASQLSSTSPAVYMASTTNTNAVPDSAYSMAPNTGPNIGPNMAPVVPAGAQMDPTCRADRVGQADTILIHQHLPLDHVEQVSQPGAIGSPRHADVRTAAATAEITTLPQSTSVFPPLPPVRQDSEPPSSAMDQHDNSAQLSDIENEIIAQTLLSNVARSTHQAKLTRTATKTDVTSPRDALPPLFRARLLDTPTQSVEDEASSTGGGPCTNRDVLNESLASSTGMTTRKPPIGDYRRGSSPGVFQRTQSIDLIGIRQKQGKSLSIVDNNYQPSNNRVVLDANRVAIDTNSADRLPPLYVEDNANVAASASSSKEPKRASKSRHKKHQFSRMNVVAPSDPVYQLEDHITPRDDGSSHHDPYASFHPRLNERAATPSLARSTTLAEDEGKTKKSKKSKGKSPSPDSRRRHSDNESLASSAGSGVDESLFMATKITKKQPLNTRSSSSGSGHNNLAKESKTSASVVNEQTDEPPVVPAVAATAAAAVPETPSQEAPATAVYHISGTVVENEQRADNGEVQPQERPKSPKPAKSTGKKSNARSGKMSTANSKIKKVSLLSSGKSAPRKGSGPSAAANAAAAEKTGSTRTDQIQANTNSQAGANMSEHAGVDEADT